MRLSHLLAGLLALAPVAAYAAGPTIQPDYQINLGPLYSQPAYDHMQMCSWLDTNNTLLFAVGQPTPCSPLSPLPVTLNSTAAGSGSATAQPVQNPDGSPIAGTDPTSASPPSGGTGERGWLGAIYAKLMGSLTVTGTFWQAVQPVSGTVTTQPATATLTACQAGTGSAIATVGSTATPVCAAGTTRTYWRIANMGAAGSPYVYCTDDGSTPTLSHWTFVAYLQGFQDTAGMGAISAAALSCIASGSVSIVALAAQTGASP